MWVVSEWRFVSVAAAPNALWCWAGEGSAASAIAIATIMVVGAVLGRIVLEGASHSAGRIAALARPQPSGCFQAAMGRWRGGSKESCFR